MSELRANEELDPNEGPGFASFVVQAVAFAAILLLIPVGLFNFGWPVWLLTVLLAIDMVLLFLVSMTAVFLLRVFFARQRRPRAGAPPKPRVGARRVITTGSEHGDGR